MVAGLKRGQEEVISAGEDGIGKRRKADENSPPNAVKVPSYSGTLNKTTDGNLPKLPAIIDGTLEKRVFTHQGSIDAANSHRVDLSYERLEFLGDAYLECIATRIIYDRYPNLTAGKLSQIRESLINNVVLSEHAKRYGFHKRIDVVNLDRKAITKVYADIFEAYVAAIVMQSPESGFATAETWLHALWTPRLKRWDQETSSAKTRGKPTITTTTTTAVDNDDVPSVQPLHAKQELATKVLSKDIKLLYIDERPPDFTSEKGRQTFFVGVFLTGWGYECQRLGSGTGLSRKEASHHAAVDALTTNSDIVETIAAKKRAFDERVKAERQRAEKERKAEAKTK
ncbi:MAG: hypothetical protein M1816_001047 [Peltula sp. TS41687]|nr:MAG: hypothetical protein M1816_001047 [Peltula sp. TS41687]